MNDTSVINFFISIGNIVIIAFWRRVGTSGILLRCRLHILAASVASILMISPATADIFTYSYTGMHFTNVQNPYTSSNSISGNLTISTPIQTFFSLRAFTPISFNFTDGISVISDLNATFSGFQFATDNMGAITQWDIYLISQTPDHYTRYQSFDAFFNQGFFGFSHNVADEANSVVCSPVDPLVNCSAAYNSGFIVGSSGTWSLQSSGVAVSEPDQRYLLGSLAAGLVLLGWLRTRQQANG